MATHSSILAWRTPMYGGARWATVHWVAKRVCTGMSTWSCNVLGGLFS